MAQQQDVQMQHPINRIVGGSNVMHKYPWIAAIVNPADGKQFCMASLITERMAITAKHCFPTDRPVELWIGGLDLTKKDQFVVRKVANVIKHPSCDVALLQLDSPVSDRSTLNVNSNPVIPVGKKGIVIGFGRTSESGPTSKVLQQVVLPVVAKDTCLKSLGDRFNPEYELCAGFPGGGKDSCQGDSGGPLIVAQNPNDNTTQCLVGITSWGIGCARSGVYGAWVNVATITEWIRHNAPLVLIIDAFITIPGIISNDDNAPNEKDPVQTFTPVATPSVATPKLKIIERFDNPASSSSIDYSPAFKKGPQLNFCVMLMCILFVAIFAVLFFYKCASC